MTVSIKDLYADATNFVRLSSKDLFALDTSEVEKIQLHHFQVRFQQLRERLGALRRLSEDIGITSIATLDDLASLAFPHTMYKSYAVADVEAHRFDRLTKFLQSLTTHDLSRVDTKGVASLDDWMDRLEANSPLRPTLSSGTSGKISIFPRSTVEEPFWYEHVLRIFDDPYREEDTIAMRTGKIPFISIGTALLLSFGSMQYPQFKRGKSRR